MFDPKNMGKMMKQMGIGTKQLPATKVTIETSEGKIIITSPEVTEIAYQGQKSYQIAGHVSIEEALNEEDVKLVMEKASVTREEAISALKKTNGDVAEAIISLS